MTEKEPVKSSDLVCFVENQRSIIGELVLETDTSIQVKNPSNVYLQPTPDGQIQVQIFPFWFSELLSEEQRKKGTVWSFNKSSITLANEHIEIDDRLVQQYNRSFGYLPPQQIVTPRSSDKVIKLFDE
jgi:hypothetical protein